MSSFSDLEQAARRVSQETGFPIATILGQSWAETSGDSANAPGNNWFGIKGKGRSQKTYEIVNGKRVNINANFQGFNTPEEAVRRYIEVVERLVPNWKDFADQPARLIARIRDAGYATEEPVKYIANATNNPAFRKYENEPVKQVKGASVVPQMQKSPYSLSPAQDYSLQYQGIRSPLPQREYDITPTPKPPSIIDKVLSGPNGKPSLLQKVLFPQAEAAELNYSPVSNGIMNYTVKPGDTLWGIAQQYMGGGSNYNKIRGYTGSPTQLPVGQRLQIPRQAPQRSSVPTSYSAPIQKPVQQYSQPSSQPSAQLNFSPSKPKAVQPSVNNLTTRSGLRLTI